MLTDAAKQVLQDDNTAGADSDKQYVQVYFVEVP